MVVVDECESQGRSCGCRMLGLNREMQHQNSCNEKYATVAMLGSVEWKREVEEHQKRHRL